MTRPRFSRRLRVGTPGLFVVGLHVPNKDLAEHTRVRFHSFPVCFPFPGSFIFRSIPGNCSKNAKLQTLRTELCTSWSVSNHKQAVDMNIGRLTQMVLIRINMLTWISGVSHKSDVHPVYMSVLGYRFSFLRTKTSLTYTIRTHMVTCVISDACLDTCRSDVTTPCLKEMQYF